MRRLSLVLGLFLTLVLVGAVLWWAARPSWTVERVRDVVIATLQEEQPASDLVTGRLSVTARHEIRDRTRFSWIPESITLPGERMFASEVRVEVPGEVLYGFDVRALTPEMIALGDDGVVEVAVPTLRVIAVEADLERLEVHSRAGIFRVGAVGPLEREARAAVHEALRAQGERYLQASTQPAINTANALAAALRPAFVAAGMRDPRFRFHLGGGLVLEPLSDPGRGDGPARLNLPADR